MSTYRQKLPTRGGSRKRLEDHGERDGFLMPELRREDITLHVHHKYYPGPRREYDNSALVTLYEALPRARRPSPTD